MSDTLVDERVVEDSAKPLLTSQMKGTLRLNKIRDYEDLLQGFKEGKIRVNGVK